MIKPIFLIGFMGSGKTTWGKKIANAMNIPFLDLDHEIVSFIEMSIPEYFKLHGEAQFRKIEQQVLKQQAGKTGIISTGGGTPCYFDNMSWLLENGTVIYLKHTSKSLWRRLGQSDINKRPSLKGLTGDQLFNFINEKLTERKPFYEKAHIQVDQINVSLETLIEIIQQNQQTNEK